MRALTGLFLLVVTACGNRLTAIDSDLEVDRAGLTFPATAVGDTRTLPLTLRNATRAPLDLHVSAPAPFALDRDLHLSGAETFELAVTFTPPALGPFSATLRLSGSVELEVPLTGEGLEAVACAPIDACHLAQRDPDTNSCQQTLAPDGTACTSDNACLAAGQCVAGVCMGAAVSCDDGDLCTLDACEAVGGCAHFALTCPAPADPCQVARCDPALGCATAPAADGTSCGPSDCTTAHVCLSGACKVLPVPEGYACGNESPCQSKGRCVQGACSQAPAAPLVESWRRALGVGADFRGVTDPSGNLYWVECGGNIAVDLCSLVSTTPSGVERFRKPAPGGSGLHLWSDGRVVVVSRNALSALSDATGAQLWSRALTQQVQSLVADRRGQLVMGTYLEGQTDGAPDRWVLSWLDAATGALTRAQELNGPMSQPVLDAQDNVYLEVSGVEQPVGMALPLDGGQVPVHSGAGPRVHVVSFSPTASLRFVAVNDPSDRPLSVFNGELLLESGSVLSTLDGHVITHRARVLAPGPLPSPLMSTGWRYRFDGLNCCPQCDCAEINHFTLQGWASGAAAPRWEINASFPYVDETSQSLLLADGSALFAARVSLSTTALRSIDSSGAQRFACELSNDALSHWSSVTSMSRGGWVALEQLDCPFCTHAPPPVLRVFPTGLDLASTGWTGLGGNPGRSGRPR
ncbi:MAG: hypothetical protein IPJ65_00685 [Archangiaceae bacterium]|nr:hypothetical protein [Archangiaceae bacterium]